ncbi:MAG: protease family protein [Acidimicrobiaceae bacterium]|nr:protease family protein [Acidimicrobiaceae bacterium]
MSDAATPHDAGPDHAGSDDPNQPKRWGLGHALIGYVVAYLLAGLAVGVYAGLAGVHEGQRTLGLAIASLLGLWTGMAGAVVFAVRRQPGGTLPSEFGLAFQWSDVPLGAAVGLASQLFLVRLLYLPFQLNDPDLARKLEKPARELTDLAHGPAFAVLAVLITVGAPLVEELFFRGLLQRSLLRRLGPVWAVGLSAAAFGLAHYQPLQLLGLVAFGVVLGLLAWRTGRLGPGIIAHVFFNLVTVVALAASR